VGYQINGTLVGQYVYKTDCGNFWICCFALDVC